MGGDFELSTDELRVVVRFAAESAAESLPWFEVVAPEDERPRAALAAAQVFVDRGRRSRLQRDAAVAAHRASAQVPDQSASLAARACGDAAAAAYLHPLARATQVGHILRASACRARIAELAADGDPAAGAASLRSAAGRATPVLVEVLGRYPVAPVGRERVAQLMSELDAMLRGRTQ